MGRKQTENWRLAAQAAQTFLLFTPLGPGWKLFTYTASGFLINGLLNPKSDRPEELEKSYGWRHIGNPGASEGSAMPVIYGKVRVQPTIKNRFVTTESGKQYLHVLYSFASHRIDERAVALWSLGGSTGSQRYEIGDEVQPIASAPEPGKTYVCTKAHNIVYVDGGVVKTRNYTDTNYWNESKGTAAITNITINGNTITNYPDLEYFTRPGLAEQTIIEGFDVTYSSNPQSGTADFKVGTGTSEIDKERGQWTTVTTTAVNTQNIDLSFYFPNGLFSSDNQGNVAQNGVAIYAQYRKVGATTWINFDFGHQTRSNNRTDINRVFDYSNTLQSLNYGDVVQGVILRKEINAFYLSFKAQADGTYLDPGQYEVRFGVNSYVLDIITAVVEVTNVATIVYGSFTYPGEPLLGIRALADGELNTDIDLRAVCERSTVDVYDPTISTWVKKSANIHAWAVYDMLCAGSTDHTDRTLTYGGGVSHTQLDNAYSEFLAWATYSSLLLGYSLNIVFDTFQELWNAILQVQQEGMGVVYPAGSEYHVIKDQALASDQLVNVALTNLGSFKRQWFDKTRKANLIEVTYFDEDRGYEPTTFAVRTADWDDQDRLSDPAKLVLYGTNNFNQAYALAKYKLNCNELLNQIATANLDVDSLQVGIGDVLKVQHDIPEIGDGGLVFGTATDTLIFDKVIDFSPSIIPLVVFIRRSDDVTYSLLLDNPGVAQDHADLKAGQSWFGGVPPAKYDPYIVGLADTSYKQYRVIDIARSDRTMPRVTLLEYNADTYDPDLIPNLGLPDKTTFNVAQNLRAVEILSRRHTGEYESAIRLSWDSDPAQPFGEWEIFFRDVDAGDINWTGNWATGSVYSTDDKVIHAGSSYVSLMDNNVGLTPDQQSVPF